MRSGYRPRDSGPLGSAVWMLIVSATPHDNGALFAHRSAGAPPLPSTGATATQFTARQVKKKKTTRKWNESGSWSADSR